MAALEGWQWPEERKLAACDMVVDNTGAEEDLRAQARTLLAALTRRRQNEEEALLQHLAALWNRSELS